MHGHGRRAAAARARFFTAALLALLAALAPEAARAQWAADPGGNISNTNAGNVGVGTGQSAPAGRLDVRQIGNTGLYATLLTSFGASEDTFIRGGSAAAAVHIGDLAATTSKLLLMENGGNVGIGLASPVSRLDTNGYVRVESSNNYPSGGGAGVELGYYAGGDYGQVLSINREASAYRPLRVDGSAVLLNAGGGGGFVGVGTADPRDRLHVEGGQLYGMLRVSGTGLAAVNLRDNGAGADAKFYQLRSDGGLFRLNLINDAESAFVRANILAADSAGNVGVGTASPAYRLDVAGAVNASAAGGLCIGGDCRTSWASVGGQWSGNAGGAGINYGGGNVGIGVASPSSPLTVRGAAAHLTPVLDLQGNGDLKMAPQGVIFFDGNYSYTGGSYIGPYSATSQAYEADTIKVTTAGAERMRINGAGNVGIGTATPTHTLEVNGTINASQAITGATINATYQDVAEWVPSVQKLTAGTVVVLDAGRTNHVVASSSAYDTKVAGVVSAQPGVILGTGGEGKVKVATTGRVKVKVDATRGAIKVGDLLVTSGVEGVAMKSVPVDLGGTPIHRPGTIIGKALEPLESGTGEILVLLSLQ